MALMDIVHYGDPILRKKCNEVKDFKGLNKLIDDMFDTMYEENGIGLAANQVGVDLNLFIIDISDIDAMLAKASPLNPSVLILNKSSNFDNLLV